MKLIEELQEKSEVATKKIGDVVKEFFKTSIEPKLRQAANTGTTSTCVYINSGSFLAFDKDAFMQTLIDHIRKEEGLHCWVTEEEEDNAKSLFRRYRQGKSIVFHIDWSMSRRS